jgi:hypothetical protein
MMMMKNIIFGGGFVVPERLLVEEVYLLHAILTTTRNFNGVYTSIYIMYCIYLVTTVNCTDLTNNCTLSRGISLILGSQTGYPY